MIEVDPAALQAQGATPEEAAAVIAAIERFTREVTASAGPLPEPPGQADGWLRTGRLEDVGAAPEELGAWGDGHPWGTR